MTKPLPGSLHWALAAAFLSLAPAGGYPQGVVLNEIHYEPPDNTLAEEFIEVYNAGGAEADLSGAFFSSGIRFTIPEGIALRPGEYLVIAEDPDAFAARFGMAPDLGPYEGRLANEGERLVLRDRDGDLIDEVDYAVRFPWPIASAGKGSSMELIHPSLDNDLGGSWRASGYSAQPPVPPRFFVPAQSSGWRYRKGTSEASNPPSTWRLRTFVEDGSWTAGRASIGYGDGDDNTVLADMQGNYSSVYLRHSFFVESAADIPETLKLRVYIDDGCAVWINGIEVGRFFVSDGEKAYDDFGINHEAAWDEVEVEAPDTVLVAGENILAIHGLNQSLSSSDFSVDAALFAPGTEEFTLGDPTPGRQNSIWSVSAPPQIRQVAHNPRQPPSGSQFAVTAKVTDPDGVAEVRLRYQVVRAGAYVPAFLPLPITTLLSDPNRPLDRNPEFEDPRNWSELVMVDDGSGFDTLPGDGVFTAALPPQDNRSLVRYRVAATDTAGSGITVPLLDDPSLNFAAFVYDGVPAYVAETRTVQPGGPPYIYPRSLMNSLPVYFLITRSSDLRVCIAYDSSYRIPKSNEGARDKFNWEGAFVYEGAVYDHVRYRLRQANDRYGGSGKRSMRFRFRKGRYLNARDQYGRLYPTRWRTLNTGKMFDNKRVGNFGLTETLNNQLWNMVGVPAPVVHTFHFRVIDAVEEAPAGVNGQHLGDFWGMHLAFEDFDTRFLEAHELEDGNLYKLKDGIFDGNLFKRHQGRDAVKTDADFQNIRNNLRPERTDQWLNDYVNYDRWYPYHAVVEGVRHYDFRPADSHSKNRAWYFELTGPSPFGRLWTLPHDSDASWGPNWNDGVDYSKNAIFGGAGKPAFKQRYRNVLREFRDLLWTEEDLTQMIDDLAAHVLQFSKADRDRWRNAPSEAGSQDFGPIETKIQDMKNFAFVGWSGSTGPTVPAGGRARHLENLANAEGDAASIPDTPVARYAGPAGFPVDGLTFETSPFSDPQGSGTFGAMQWRTGEVWNPAAPGFDPGAPRVYEWEAVWESGVMPFFSLQIALPPWALKVGHTYRVRVRVMDSTQRWSHWSAPVEFTVGEPSAPFRHEEALRITEIMYNPLGGRDFEFVELFNKGPGAVDLRGVRFTDGIEFSFGAGEESILFPGDYVVVVRDLRAFEARYDTRDIRVAGEFSGGLDNGGETVALSYGGNTLIQEFAYDDSWYPFTDGLGHSLEIVDPQSPLGVWSVQSGWQESGEVNGTPGLPPSGNPLGGLQRPGDANQDGVIDISDAIALLRQLFTGSVPLPCDGDLAAGGGALVLLDVNEDEGVDLSDAVHLLDYLFKSGSPPARGSGCVRVAGCPNVCGR